MGKKEPWQIVAGILAIAWIVFLWIKKDILSVFAQVPSEELIPVLITTVAVTLLKVALLTGGVLFLKWLLKK